MNRQIHYSFNSGIRFLNFALAIFFAVLAVSDEYKDQGANERFEELVSEAEFEVSIFPSSLTRPSSSKLTKIERLEVIKIVNRIFELRLPNPNVGLARSFEGHIVLNCISLFSKSDILTNAP